jgi:ribonuclease HI
MRFDGSKTIHGLGVGIVLTSPKNNQLRYVLQIHFAALNNVAEYEALVHGLKVSKDIGIHRIMCFGDSDLVVQQCSGIWDAHDANMASYRFLVQQISGYFEGCEFRHVSRAQNDAADTLSKLGSSRESILPGISLEHLRKPSIKPSPESTLIYVPPSPEEAVPMEIDAGVSADNPGTLSSVPGTGPTYTVTAVFWSKSKGKGKMYQEVEPLIHLQRIYNS